MTDAEELLRAALLDPGLDRDTDDPEAAATLLAGVLARRRRLRRRRQQVATLAAAAAAVAVLGGVAVGVALGSGPPGVAPARQPDLVVVPAPTTPRRSNRSRRRPAHRLRVDRCRCRPSRPGSPASGSPPAPTASSPPPSRWSSPLRRRAGSIRIP